MSSYTEIDTALLDLDFTNPRIQNYLQNYPEESRSGELLAMLLGTGTDSCASLKESIKELVLCQDLVQVKMRNFSPF